MKKIALVYLDVSNLGDLVIYDTARYITEEILEKNNLTDIEIVPVDMGSYQYKVKGLTHKNLIVRGWSFIENKTGKKIRKVAPRISREMLIRAWRKKPMYTYFMENEFPKLEGCDLILFGGGGLIKYHRQDFHYLLNEITDYAEKNNIPVLINAQGIEGFSGSNPECKILKKAINRECVKYISTRDDYDTLQNKYINNPDIVVKAVCDPAFWTKETYGVERHPKSKPTIGIGVIRTKIFKEYMYEVTEEELADVYYPLIMKLRSLDYEVELFSNGVAQDNQFIDYLLERYPDLKAEYGITVALPKTPRELVELLGSYERFVAIRLHAAIIGSVLGVPNVSLVWNRKQQLFGEQIGMPQNFLEKQDFNADTIAERLLNAQAYEMNEEYKNSVVDSLEEELIKWL